MSDEKIRYVLDVDDKGTPKIVKFGAAAEKSGKQASKGFDSASKSVSDFAEQIPGLGGAMSSFAAGPAAAAGAAVAAVAVGFAAITKKSIDFADNMNDLSLRLGVSTERLSVLSLYAEQSGTDIETLASAMGKLGAKMSQGDKTLKGYGITAGSVDEALFQLADRIAGTTDPMLRLKIATDAFGKSGQQMLPLLVQGGDALRTMSKEAPIVSQELATMADNFNDKMAGIKGKFSQIGLEIATGLLPYLDKAVDGFAKLFEGMTKGETTGGKAEVALGAIDRKIAYLEKGLSAPGISSASRANLQKQIAEQRQNRMEWAGAIMEGKMSSGSLGGSMAGYSPSAAPAVGVFGAGATPAKGSKAEAQFAMAPDDPNWSFRYNQARGANFEAAKLASGDTDSEAAYQKRVAAGKKDAEAMRGASWYVGVPLTPEALNELEEMAIAAEEVASAENQKATDERIARNKAAMQTISGDMKNAFSSAYADIWANGRDAFSALYDAFSEQFTSRVIDSLASLSSNGLMALLTGGASAPAGGILGMLGFAGGGNPPEGSPVMVGERRAEMFIPRGPGRIDPTAGSGSVVNITVSNVAQAATLKRRLEREDRRGNRGVR